MNGSRDSPTPDELFEHADFLRSLARSLAGDAAQAEDLVQDTWVAALEGPPPRQGSLRGWLATVIRHLAASARRGEARRSAREARTAREEAVPPEHEALERLEVTRELVKAVLELSEPHRTAIYLRYHAGLGPSAIAERLGVPVKTVKTRLTRALAQLRERLGHSGTDWRPALVSLASPPGAAAGAGLLAASIAGGLAMKKMLFAAAALVAAALLWQAARPGAPRPRLEADLAQELAVLQPSSPAKIEASAEERAVVTVSEAPANPRPIAPVRLQPVLVISRATGLPVPGAEVLWLRQMDFATRAHDASIRGVSFEQLLEREGERAIADALGVVQIARGPGTLAIIGRAPGLWGQGTSNGDGPRELRLELAPDASIDVEVVDFRGAPVEGVPVALQLGSNNYGESVLTDADGRARIEHVLVRPPVAVAVRTLLREPLLREIDPEALPGEPVRLVLPPTGSVEVIVRTPDGAPPGEGTVYVQRIPPVPGPGELLRSVFASSSAAPTEAGRALIRHVEPGLELRVEARPQGSFPAIRSTSISVSGPAAAGERTRVAITLGSDHPTLWMRVLDETGAPLSGAPIHMSISSPGSLAGGHIMEVVADAEGGLELHLQERPNPPDPRQLTLHSIPAPGEPAREGLLALEPRYPPGPRHLGDVQLSPAPLIASGVVFECDGSPLEGATLYVELFDGDERYLTTTFGIPDTKGATWRTTRLRATSAADGGFELHGTLPPGRTSILAVADGLSPVRFECERGAKDVRIRMADIATISGRIVTDSVAPLDQLHVKATLESVGGVPASQLGLPIPFRNAVQPRPDGTFSIPDLHEGTWTVTVQQPEFRRSLELRRIEGVQLFSGRKAIDPRLERIDVRGAFRTIRIELELPAGQIPGVCEWRERGGSGRSGSANFAKGYVELKIVDAPLDIAVLCLGHRPVVLESVGEDRRVQLEPGLDVRLRLPPGLRLPEGPPRLVGSIYATGPLGLGGQSSPRLPFDASGEITFRACGPGRLGVGLNLERDPGRSVGSRPLGPSWHPFELVESDSEQVLLLDLSQAQIDAALAELQR